MPQLRDLPDPRNDRIEMGPAHCIEDHYLETSSRDRLILGLQVLVMGEHLSVDLFRIGGKIGLGDLLNRTCIDVGISLHNILFRSIAISHG